MAVMNRFECKLALMILCSDWAQTHKLKKWEQEKKKWVAWACANFIADAVNDSESNNERKPVFNTRDEPNKQYHKMLNIDADAITVLIGNVIFDLCDHGAKIQCTLRSELSYSQVAYYLCTMWTTKVNKLKFFLLLIISTEPWKCHFRGELYLQDIVTRYNNTGKLQCVKLWFKRSGY